MRAFIDRVADGVAVLLIEGGGRAYVPADRLPTDAVAGRVVDVSVTVPPMPADAVGVDEIASWIERLRAGEHRHG